MQEPLLSATTHPFILLRPTPYSGNLYSHPDCVQLDPGNYLLVIKLRTLVTIHKITPVLSFERNRKCTMWWSYSNLRFPTSITLLNFQGKLLMTQSNDETTSKTIQTNDITLWSRSGRWKPSNQDKPNSVCCGYVVFFWVSGDRRQRKCLL